MSAEQDGLHTPIEPDVKRPKKDGLKIKDETSTKNMPYMKSVDGLPQLWSLWEAGSPDQGIGAISLLGDRTRREKGFNRQRFHEWSTVASEIQQQAFQGGIHPRQRAEELELERKAIKASMPQYAKILMSQFKDRRVRYQGHPGTPQDPNTFPQPQIQENLDAKTMTELAQEAAQPDNVVHEPVPEPQLTHDAKIDWASLQWRCLSTES